MRLVTIASPYAATRPSPAPRLFTALHSFAPHSSLRCYHSCDGLNGVRPPNAYVEALTPNMAEFAVMK